MRGIDKAGFDRDGFCVVRGLVSAEEIARIGQWADALALGPNEPGGVMRYHEEAPDQAGRSALSRVEYFRLHHAGLRSFMETGAVPVLMAELLDEEAVLFKDKINYKTPGGAAFEPHQDAQAGWLDYCAFQLSCLIAIDPAGRENGGLELAAGHHRRGLIGERGQPLGPDSLRGVDFKLYETAPGDAVFFGSFVPHRSGPNTSLRPRRLLYLTYNARSAGDHYATYFAAKRASFPPDWERDPERVYRYRV